MTQVAIIDKVEIESWLPLFSGFYHTIWSPDGDEIDEADSIGYEYNLDLDDPHLIGEAMLDATDYEEFEHDVVKEITDHVGEELRRRNLVTDWKFENVTYPREYNFKNNSGNVTWTLTRENMNTILSYLMNNADMFKEYLKERYTSRSGFISFYSNQMEDWVQETFNFTELDVDGHRLGSLYEFILLNEGVREFDIYEMTDITIHCYIDRDEVVRIARAKAGVYNFIPSGYYCKYTGEELNLAHLYDYHTVQKAKQFEERTGKRPDVVGWVKAEEIFGKPVTKYAEALEERDMSIYADEDGVFDPLLEHALLKPQF